MGLAIRCPWTVRENRPKLSHYDVGKYGHDLYSRPLPEKMKIEIFRRMSALRGVFDPDSVPTQPTLLF